MLAAGGDACVERQGPAWRARRRAASDPPRRLAASQAAAAPGPWQPDHLSSSRGPRVCSVAQPCLTLCHPMDCGPARFLCPWDFSGKTPFPPPGIFLIQGSNQRLPHWQADSLPVHKDVISYYITAFTTTEPAGKFPCGSQGGLNARAPHTRLLLAQSSRAGGRVLCLHT